MCKIEIFDGAMGTMLQAGGLQPGACPELMNVENPEVVKNIHRAYIEAGATIIETNTFGASPLKLEHYGLTDRMAELNTAAVKIAKEAAQGRAKVAGSMGPTGRFIEPLGDLAFDEAYDNFFAQAQALAQAGADYLIIETCIDIQEMRAALLAAKDACDIPVICQLSGSRRRPMRRRRSRAPQPLLGPARAAASFMSIPPGPSYHPVRRVSRRSRIGHLLIFHR